jgi:hypothetical protein
LSRRPATRCTNGRLSIVVVVVVVVEEEEVVLYEVVVVVLLRVDSVMMMVSCFMLNAFAATCRRDRLRGAVVGFGDVVVTTKNAST